MNKVARRNRNSKHPVAMLLAHLLRRRFSEGDRAPCHPATERLLDDPVDRGKVFCRLGGELYTRKAAA